MLESIRSVLILIIFAGLWAFTLQKLFNVTIAMTVSNISNNTTRTPGNDDDDSDELSDEDVVRNTTLRPGNTIPSRRTTTATTRRTTVKVDSDESDDYDGSEDEEDRRMRQDDAVCYMVKLIVNDTIITKRGCATMIRGNNVQTCKSISSGWSMDDCQLCDTDGCNKFADDDFSWEAVWNGGEQLGKGVWFILPTVLLKILL
ncbi:unnamed protein product [Ceratitis capitata]|uniref:(Mediterranean fruit fly) hypothetical protein n=1 Tax=Ceratitis capitata TaxID=7213 RepID=A0A811UTK7_CERCA|nr:unnamed protein product [Ceratitis capitata]